MVMKHYLPLLAVLVACACLPVTKSVGDANATETGGTDTDTETDTTTGDGTQTDATTDTGGPVCASDEPVGGGVYFCGGIGFDHQKEPAMCGLAAPRPCENPGEGSNCTADADCGGDSLCKQHDDVDFGSYCRCGPPPCETAADCGSGTTCYCGSSTNGACLPSNCATDEDCDGMLCAVSVDACGVHGLYCTTAEDLCVGNSDWPCTYVPENGRWEPIGAIGCP